MWRKAPAVVMVMATVALGVLLVSDVNAFSLQSRAHFPSMHSYTRRPFRRSSFAVPSYHRMANDANDKKGKSPAVSSGKREIGYDENKGRLIETSFAAKTDECEPNDEFCTVDKRTGKLIRLTVEEKERIFLDALQSYYVSGRQMLSDAEFDLLKEDLQWNGSPMVSMNRREALYLNAMQAYLKGTPVMSDTEWNTLKSDLREEGSKFAVTKEPRCYIDTGICTVTLQEDFFRTNLLYLPVAIILTSIWLGPIFEIVAIAIRFNPLIFLLFGAYPIYRLTPQITEKFIFQDFKIAYGPCPACETENRVYFGDILFVDGFKDVAEVKCTNCKEKFRVQRKTLRASTLPSPS